MKLKCQKCNYQWAYKGFKLNATCPNCLSKVKTKPLNNPKVK